MTGQEFPKRVIIESPYAAETEAGVERNMEYLAACIFDSLDRNEAPFASHGFYTIYLEDGNLQDRAQGMIAGWSWMRAAELVAVYSDLGISEGMKRGMDLARQLGIEVEERSIGVTEDASDNDD